MTATDTRYHLHIPSPDTRLTAGKWYLDSNWAGISVDTASHVRFYANGSSASASDIVAQATGQVWLHSLQKMVGFATKDLMIISPSSTTVAAEGGITIMSGFSPGTVSSETTPGTFPSAIESYEAKAAIATGIWVIFDTFMALTITAVSVALTLKDGSMDRWAYEGSAANIAGAAVNLAGLSFIPWSANVSLPGINLFSQAGTLIGAAFGAVTIVGLPGTLIASTFTTQFGLLTAGVRGLFSCGMNALGPVDVTALGDVTCRSYKEIEISARLGETSFKGVDMTIGTEVNPWVLLPQIATGKLELSALQEVSVESPAVITATAKTLVKSSAGGDQTLEGESLALFTSGQFQIRLLPASAQVGQQAGPSIKITAAGVELEGPGKATKGKCADGNVELDAAGAKIKVVPNTSLTVDGTKFDLQ